MKKDIPEPDFLKIIVKYIPRNI